MMKNKFALLFAVILWASAFVGIRAGLEDFSPGGLALLRFIIASICITLFYILLPTRTKINFLDKLFLLFIGAFGVGGYNIALNYGELSVPSGIASFIICQSPIMTAAFAIVFLNEPFNLKLFLGMLVSIFGISLITLSGLSHVEFNLGVLYVMLAAIIGALYSLMQKPFSSKYHPIEVTAYVIWGATIVLLIYSPTIYSEITQASVNSILSVIYLGIFPAAIAYVFWSYALSSVSATKAMSFLYFMPIIATLLGWVVLGEIPAFLALVGGSIALAGVWLANHKSF